jgi:hypothetical protein
MKDDYPAWVCHACGAKYGTRIPVIATWHNGACGICYEERPVTEPRDYGYLSGWRNLEVLENRRK